MSNEGLLGDDSLKPRSSYKMPCRLLPDSEKEFAHYVRLSHRHIEGTIRITGA